MFVSVGIGVWLDHPNYDRAFTNGPVFFHSRNKSSLPVADLLGDYLRINSRIM